MKRSLDLGAVLLFLGIFALVFPVATAWSGDVILFRGDSASVVFSSADPSGCDCSVNPPCIFTDVYVVAVEQTFKSPPVPGKDSSSIAEIYISKADCDDMFLLQASCFATLANDDFQVVGNKLGSANLIATLQCLDYVSNSYFNVDVDLTWTGTGRLTRGNFHSHNSFPGCIINSNSHGTSRDADVSGTVVTDDNTNFTPDPGFGAIASVKGGEVDICQ